MAKTRYLQLNTVMMLEYVINEDSDNNSGSDSNFIFTKLKDGHYAVFSPANMEVEYNAGTNEYVKRNRDCIETFNTINHLFVPIDRKRNQMYIFLDNSYEYNTDQNTTNELDIADPKVRQYAMYCDSPNDGTDKFVALTSPTHIRMDSVKIYLANGYDFSNMYGVGLRLYTQRVVSDIPGKVEYVDLCNFFFTNTSAYNMVNFLMEPLIVGDTLYDRYIEIKVPSIYDICESDIDVPNSINNHLRIENGKPIHINVIGVDEGDYEILDFDYDIAGYLRRNVQNDKVNCNFVKASSINGAIPTERMTSDNLGAYIGESPNGKYIEFYGTWKNYPLSYEIVQRFNRDIKLYDRSYIRSRNAYEVPADYEVEIDYRKWVVMHEIVCSFIDSSGCVIDEEKYNMTQVFEKPKSALEERFYYRPILKDTLMAQQSNTMAITYTMRLINTADRVQFLKSAALSICDIGKYSMDVMRLSPSSMVTYSVYNKIVEPSKQYITNDRRPVAKTKYVKVFYNSTDVLLENDGTDLSSGTYTLELSPVAKNYKFIFKKKNASGTYEYMDLTDGYYKLYAKDNTNNDIIIEATYSSNMNMLLGELEFAINTETLSKLRNVDGINRKMSIVAYNADNSISSMYDFSYNI